MVPFEDRVALVTGASSGIGRAIAIELGKSLKKVYLCGRDLDALDHTRAEMPAGVGVLLPVDLSDSSFPETIRAALKRSQEPINILIHSAGLLALGSLHELDESSRAAMWTINVDAPYALTKALIPDLIRSSGDVVFINSTVIQNPHPALGAYAMSKHALIGLANGLRQELNKQGVRVLSVLPGRTATPMQSQLTSFEGIPYHPEQLLQPQSVAQCVVQAIRLSEDAEVTEIVIRPRHRPQA